MPNPSSPTGPRSSRRISWDVIRVVALLSVVLGHITHQSMIYHPELGGYPFSVTAQYGASTLLVVSAYFVCASLRKGAPGRWLWKRIARLLPAYLTAVLITYVVTRFGGTVFNGQHLAPGLYGSLFGLPTGAPATGSPWYLPTGLDLFANLTLIQPWSNGFHWLDGSYWTLPVQLMAFASAAVLWPRRWRTDRRVLGLIWALLLVPLVLRFVILDSAVTPAWFYGFGLHRTHVFAAGVAIWLWAERRVPTWHLAWLLGAVVVAQDLQMYPLHHATAIDPARGPSIAGFAVMLLVICIAARGPDWNLPFRRWLSPAIGWLASISYGVYLVHQELGYLLARALLAAHAASWERLLLILTAAILAGWLLTVFVERPVHRWLTRRRERAPAGPALPDQPRPAFENLAEHPSTGTAPVSVGSAT